MNDTIIYGLLIEPKPKVKFSTTIQKKCKDFQIWVRYHQIKNRVKIQLANEL